MCFRPGAKVIFRDREAEDLGRGFDVSCRAVAQVALPTRFCFKISRPGKQNNR